MIKRILFIPAMIVWCPVVFILLMCALPFELLVWLRTGTVSDYLTSDNLLTRVVFLPFRLIEKKSAACC